MAGFSGVKTKLGPWVATTLEGRRPEGAPEDAALWSGAPVFPEPPAVDARVIARGGFGPSVVVGYFVEHGYLGIALRPDERPEWHLRQNPGRDVVLLFGKELECPEAPATAPEWRHRDGQSTAHLFPVGARLSQCSAVERERTTPAGSVARCKRCTRSAAGGPRSKNPRAARLAHDVQATGLHGITGRPTEEGTLAAGTLVRALDKRAAEDGIRSTFEASTDGGRTWVRQQTFATVTVTTGTTRVTS